MHEILPMSNCEVTANRSRRGVLRIRGSHERTHNLPRLLGALNDEDQHGTLGYELDELDVVGLTQVLGVMTFGRRSVNRAQLTRDDAQLFGFEATDDLTDEAARNAVGLHNKKRSIHNGAI